MHYFQFRGRFTAIKRPRREKNRVGVGGVGGSRNGVVKGERASCGGAADMAGC